MSELGFYGLPKKERQKLVEGMRDAIWLDLENETSENLEEYASDQDTYVRKNAYLIIGRLYRDERALRETILAILNKMFRNDDEKVRQTAVYALGEIGKVDAKRVIGTLKEAMEDERASVRNGVVGALKQMGEKNPTATLEFAKELVFNPDPKVRKEIIHGIELRGRTHPEDILPLLAEVQNDPDGKVRERVVHVLGQISYKKGCLEKVVGALQNWENKELVGMAAQEILKVHKNYGMKGFSARSYEEAKDYLVRHLSL